MNRTASGKFTGGIIFSPSTNTLKERWGVNQEKNIYFHPDRVYIPLQQQIGAPSEAVVAEGDLVTEGDLIGKAGGFVGANIHASITGTVKKIVDWPDASGNKVSTVVIQRDKHAVPVSFNKKEDYQTLTKKQLIERISQAGIVGMGGATFPTHVKLTVDDDITVKSIVLNGAECELFLEADALLMEKEAHKVITGAKIAQKVFNAQEILIAIESDKPRSVAAMEKAAQEFADVDIITVPTNYPQGGEKQLLESLLDIEVTINGGLPVESGAYLMNVSTSAAVADAVEKQQPLIRRYCTVSGDIHKQQTVIFPIGTLSGDLIDFCGGFDGLPEKILMGGPMMGRALDSLDVPLTKSSNGLIVIGKKSNPHFEESPCIRCNICSEVCPMRLEPQNIDLFYRQENIKRCQDLKADACINCGACSYVCPARRDLARNISAASNEIKKLIKEAEQSA
ncbi:electron transport complex subunit RsxC [Enterococcus sp. LJL99]